MITEIYTPIDKACEKSLIDIQKVIGSDSFLAGLGVHSNEYPVPNGFNAITDYERCIYLLTSQLMWDKPKKRNGDKNFSEVLDDAVDYLGYPAYERDEAKRRKGYFFSRPKTDARHVYLEEITTEACNKNEIVRFLQNNHPDLSQDTVESFVKGNITQSILTCFNIFIRCAYFGGLKKWPLSEYLLKCYSIGGFPTGWVGPLFKDGGQCEVCMQTLHFGPIK